MTDGFPLHPGFDEILKFCRDFLAFSSLTLPNVHTLNSTGCKCTRVNEWGGERRGKGEGNMDVGEDGLLRRREGRTARAFLIRFLALQAGLAGVVLASFVYACVR